MKIHYVKIQFATLFSKSERQNPFFTCERTISSNHKAPSRRIVFLAHFVSLVHKIIIGLLETSVVSYLNLSIQELKDVFDPLG